MNTLAQLGIAPIFGLFFASFFLATFVLIDALTPPSTRAARRRGGAAAGSAGPDAPPVETAIISRAVELASQAAAKRGLVDVLQTKLDQAGLPLRAGELIFFHMAGLVAAGLVAMFVTQSVAATVLLVALGAAAPFLAVAQARRRRAARFHDQLPDTLTLIGGALKAGYSFLQAVDMVVAETLPPMSDEFKRVITESQLGLPVEQALEHMAERVDSINFRWTVMAIKVQREVGGNLAEVLDILANTIRERDAVGRQIRALTAEGRLSAIILYVLPFAVATLLYAMNPTYLSVLFTSSTGILMIVFAAIMLVVGGVWLKKVVSIEV